MQPLKGPNNKDNIPTGYFRAGNGEIKRLPPELTPKPSHNVGPLGKLFFGITVVTALIMAFSAYLPWASVQTGQIEVSVNGMGQVGGISTGKLGDGIYVIGAAVIIGLVALVGYIKQQDIYGVVLIVLGIFAAGFHIWEINNLLQNTTGVNVGYGLILGIVTGVVTTAAGVLVRFMTTVNLLAGEKSK
jgi:hypothetical protein